MSKFSHPWCLFRGGWSSCVLLGAAGGGAMSAGRTSEDVLRATKAVVRKVGVVKGMSCGELVKCGVGCEASMDSAFPCCRVVAMSWYIVLRLSDLISGSVGAIPSGG